MRHRLIIQNTLHARVEFRFQLRGHLLIEIGIEVIALPLGNLNKICHHGFGGDIVLITELFVFPHTF